MAREVRCHQTDRRKDGRTDGLTHRPTTVTLAAHARRGLISFYIGEICVCVCVCVHVCIGCNNIHSSLLYTQGNVPQSQLDEKKLIGYAQLNIIE